MLEVHNIAKEYRTGLLIRRPHAVLKGVNFSVKTGEIVGMVGRSGCGKSTLAKIMVGLVNPDGGNILLERVDVTHQRTKMLTNTYRPIQIIFQNPDESLDPSYTLRSSLTQVLAYRKMFEDADEDDLQRLFDSISLPQDILDRYPHQVSGGEIQRVALARVLSLRPKYLILDEPTSMLDASVQAQILRSLERIAKGQGTGMVLISHNLHVVKAMCDRALVLEDGRITEEVRRDDGWRSSGDGPFQRLIDELH
jgi:peptide/nickel transport system ATP-binding protein